VRAVERLDEVELRINRLLGVICPHRLETKIDEYSEDCPAVSYVTGSYRPHMDEQYELLTSPVVVREHLRVALQQPLVHRYLFFGLQRLPEHLWRDSK
jgi:hypothetical protein